MQGPLEQAYSAVERAYGQGQFAQALELALALQPQLEAGRRDLLDQRLQLLLGHIHLHGLEQPEQAEAAYRAVLENCQEASYRQLAELGLVLCQEQRSVPPSTTENPAAEPAELSAPATNELPATPWLEQLHQPQQAAAEAPAPITAAAASPAPPEAAATPWAAPPEANSDDDVAEPAAALDVPVAVEAADTAESTDAPEAAEAELDRGLLLVKLSARAPAVTEASANESPDANAEQGLLQRLRRRLNRWGAGRR